jgi:uncharacterized membrane protein YoaK (UPF0700 family)
MTDPSHRSIIDACLLSFIAGFVDTCVFVGLFGLFTAHVTGNLALIGAQLVHHEGDVLAKLLSIPVFVGAVVVAVHLAHMLKRRGRQRIAPLLCVEAIMLLMTVVAAAMFGPAIEADDALPIVAGLLAAAAMGLQNALMRIELSSLPATTVMTVNVTQVVIDAVIVASRRTDSAVTPREREESTKRFARMWPSVLAFVAGAACGAGGYAWMRMWALCLPAILCVLLAVRFARR